MTRAFVIGWIVALTASTLGVVWTPTARAQPDLGVLVGDDDPPRVDAPLVSTAAASLMAGLPLSVEDLQARRTELSVSIDGMPAAEESGKEPEAQRAARASLEQRRSLIDAVLDARQEVARLEGRVAALPDRTREARQAEEAFEAAPALTVPETVDTDGLERFESQAGESRRIFETLEAEREKAEAQLDQLPGELQGQRTRAREAELRAKDLGERLRQAAPGAEADGMRADLETARLQALAAEASAALAEWTLRFLRLGEPLRRKRIELARQRLQQHDRLVETARDRFEAALKARHDDVRQTLEAARQVFEQAEGRGPRFLAKGRLLLAESKVGTADATALRVVLDRNLSHQRKLLGAESAEFKGISRLVERDASQRTAETLQDAFQRLDRRYVELRLARRMDGLDNLSALRTRRLEVTALVYALDDQWQLRIDELADRAAQREARDIREALRAALRSEQDIIADALASGEALLATLGDRDQVLEDLDALVRARIFWVQDKPPIGPGLIVQAQDEAVRFVQLTVAASTWAVVERFDAWPPGILALVAVVGGLLLLLTWWRLRRRLTAVWPRRVAAIERRRAARAREEAAAEARMAAEARLGDGSGDIQDRGDEAKEATERARAAATAARAAEDRALEAEADDVDDADNADDVATALSGAAAADAETDERDAAEQAAAEQTPADAPLAGLRLVLLGAVTVALLPLLLYGLARLMGWAPFVDLVREPIAAGLDMLALLALLVFSTRLLLRPNGLAPVELGLARDTTTALRRATRTGLFVALPTLVPYAALSSPPLRFEALPRLCYTAFEVVVLLLLLRVLRPRAPVMRDLLGRAPDQPPLRGTGLAWGGLAAFGTILVGMDLGGYRYGAHWLAVNALESLAISGAALLAWPIVRERVAPALAGFFDGEDTLRALSLRRARRVLRAFFALSAVLVLALIWDVDRRALGFLDAVTLYTMGSGEAASVVTLASLSRVLLTSAVMIGLLRWLPGLFGLTLFRYVDVEAGARYAIVTIARYVVFLVGVVVAFDALHVDLSQLGWLMAAIGVGLGFGLQEIVANFVSGIILLMERPIRIGDWVTIGTTEGTVQKIQIRATTLLTLDRQEIIVPNKDFITREVINWTHRDRIVRLSVAVGVAYGTDVETVRQLLIGVARQNDEVLDAPAPNALMMAHGDSSLDFQLRVHHLDPTRQAPLRSALNSAINRALIEAGIEIPFPQRDLHLRSGWPPADGALGDDGD